MEINSYMNEVKPGVYVGSISAANNWDMLRQNGITHVLTIHVTPIDTKMDGISYKFVQKRDMPDVDLLSSFQECFDFIDEAQNKGGKVLIHCLVGASRSGTIAVAYLMYKDRLSLEQALATVKEHRPLVSPNIGFMEQLQLFERMGGVIDVDNSLYRHYKLSLLAQRVQSGSFDDVKSSLLGNTDIDRTQSNYRCRKCRQALFKHSSLLTHNLGEGEAAFDWRCKAPQAPRPAAGTLENQPGEESTCKQSLFIEPVQWMADIIKELEGKLMCPKCKVKIGSFVWYGEKCPCGTWVAPAFHIQTAKVDHIVPPPAHTVQQRSPDVGLTHMSQPGPSNPTPTSASQTASSAGLVT